MNPINFVYWLQGFLEIGDPKSLNEIQIQEIRNHIALVLDKKTPYTQEVLFEHGKPNKNGDIFQLQGDGITQYTLNRYITDINGNPFPIDLFLLGHEGSC